MKLKNIIHLAGILLLLTGCSLIDLRKLKITTNPAGANEILGEDEAIAVNFNRENVERKTAEQAVAVAEGIGRTGDIVETDFNWDGSVLTVVPVKKLSPGVRYKLTVKGLIGFKDGRSYTADIGIPFYYVSDSERPYLVSFSPEDNSVCGVEVSISLTFSSGINEKSFKDNFSVSPSSEYSLNWNGNTVVISPNDKWENLTRYTWSVGEDVAGTEGIPIAEPYSHSMLVGDDSSPPGISAFYATDFTGNVLTPGQADLNYLAYRDVIYMVFTEAVKDESLSSSFQISPAFDGSLIEYSSNEYIFSPYKGWDFKTEYILTIGTDLEDLSGNKMTEPVKVIFKPDILINPVNIVQIDGNGDNTFSLNTFTSSVPVSADVDAFGQYSFTINFDTTYGVENRASVENAVACTAYFPANSEPVRNSVVWNASGNRVTLGYTGFVASVPPHEENIYKLIIRGGEETKNASGGYIPDDVYIYIKAE